jgi:NAD(P)-dependent dehydrogenase (short-subunit alcohol dehydrogenase family)
MQQLKLRNKRVIITGGASGIGRAMTKLFQEEGANIFVLDNNSSEVLPDFEVIKCDVSNQEEVLNVINKIGSIGFIDILVNNAGVAHIGNLEQTSLTDLDRIYDINIKGYYNCMLGVIPHMKQNGGCILNIASVAASVGINNRFAYSMSKGAVISMTLSVAKDYIGHNIRCNSISPARVHTPFVDGYLAENYPGREAEMFDVLSKTQPIGRMAKPEEIAHLALFLCSEEASFITGTDYPIDGGFIKLNSG